ncbi:MAG: hypothetical protein EPO21_10175 [Chloroflexota bacterium]|nr:MAG: hypothetical protein EPO21_10175 [Chloroflexota bacterium]
MGSTRTRARALDLAVAVLSVGLAFAIYRDSLTFPFFFDDPLDLVRGQGRSVLSLLMSSQEYGYYRPLPFLIWEALHKVLGRYDQTILHLLPVVLHGLNGLLVYSLGSRLISATGAIAAALLFILFPFTYQVVPWAGALFHPLVAFFVLTALLLYWTARCDGSALALVGSLCAAALAMLTHEYGVVLPLLAVALELTILQGTRTLRRLLVTTHFGLVGSYIALWLAVPKWDTSLTIDPESLRSNGLYFLQGLVYPISGLLPRTTEVSDQAAVTLLPWAAAAALAFLTLLYLYARQARVVVLLLVWFVIAVAPAWATLPWSYVVDGPRLLYLAGVPVSLLWGGAFGLLAHRLKPAPLGTGAAILGIALLSWQSIGILGPRLEMYRAGMDVVRQLVDLMPPRQERPVLVVNLPTWLAPKQNPYPLGHWGVTMAPTYVGLDQLVSVNAGSAPPVLSASYPPSLRDWDYFYAPHGLPQSVEQLAPAVRSAERVIVTDYSASTLRLRDVGTVSTAQPPELSTSDLVASFGDTLRLRRARVTHQSTELMVTLVWECLAAEPTDRTIFVHVYGPPGPPVAQGDGYALLALYPTRLWRSGEFIVDRRPIAIPSNLPPGQYRVTVGLYDRATGERSVATDRDGRPVTDNLVILETGRLP